MDAKLFTKKNVAQAVATTALTIKLIKTFELTNKNIVDDVFSVFAAGAISICSTGFIFSLFEKKEDEVDVENVEEE